MIKITIRIAVLVLMVTSALAATVVYQAERFTGTALNREITYSLLTQGTMHGSNAFFGTPLVIQPLGGRATNVLYAANYSLNIDGISGTWPFSVPDTTNTYNLWDLVNRGLYILSTTNVVIVTNAAAGGTDGITNGQADVTLAGTFVGSGGGLTNSVGSSVEDMTGLYSIDKVSFRMLSQYALNDLYASRFTFSGGRLAGTLGLHPGGCYFTGEDPWDFWEALRYAPELFSPLMLSNRLSTLTAYRTGNLIPAGIKNNGTGDDGNPRWSQAAFTRLLYDACLRSGSSGTGIYNLYMPVATNALGVFPMTNSLVFYTNGAPPLTDWWLLDQTTSPGGYSIFQNGEVFRAYAFLCELATIYGDTAHVTQFANVTNAMSGSIQTNMWNATAGLFWEGTFGNHSPSLWGSALLVNVGAAGANAQTVISNFNANVNNPTNSYFLHGALRRFPKGTTNQEAYYAPYLTYLAADVIYRTNKANAIWLVNDFLRTCNFIGGDEIGGETWTESSLTTTCHNYPLAICPTLAWINRKLEPETSILSLYNGMLARGYFNEIVTVFNHDLIGTVEELDPEDFTTVIGTNEVWRVTANGEFWGNGVGLTNTTANQLSTNGATIGFDGPNNQFVVNRNINLPANDIELASGQFTAPVGGFVGPLHGQADSAAGLTSYNVTTTNALFAAIATGVSSAISNYLATLGTNTALSISLTITQGGLALSALKQAVLTNGNNSGFVQFFNDTNNTNSVGFGSFGTSAGMVLSNGSWHSAFTNGTLTITNKAAGANNGFRLSVNASFGTEFDSRGGIMLEHAGASSLSIFNGVNFYVNAKANADATIDIGANGANRFRNVYFSSNAYVPNVVGTFLCYSNTTAPPDSNTFFKLFGLPVTAATNCITANVNGCLTNYWCNGTNVFSKGQTP